MEAPIHLSPEAPGFNRHPAPAAPVAAAGALPYYLTPDIESLSKEPLGGLMGWPELCVVVQQIADGVGYNYARLSESLCQHLGYAKRQLAASEAQAVQVAGLKQELAEQEREKLALVEELKRQTQALMLAAQALADCYEVTDWPADGQTSQDAALKAILELYPQAPTPQQPAPGERQGQQQEGGAA